jgi:CHAT domain
VGVDYEYRIEVRGGPPVTVTGFLDTPSIRGSQYGPEPLPSDPLRGRTIEVLRSWLNRWTAVQQTAYSDLAVPKTREVLGQHLYAMIIQGRVEDGLTAARTAAGTNTLRVLLSFDAQADNLAQLPWELLYDPGSNGSTDFLARAHRLVLSRSLLLSDGRRQTTPKEPPLVVYFIVAVPNTARYAMQRRQLLETLRQPAEYTSSITPEILATWDTATIRSRLSSQIYPHIVHLIGVCRRRWVQGELRLELCLDDGSGNERWVGTDALVALFDDDGTVEAEDRPRLVVLHLCEASPIDFEVTFERLAPQLIRRGIPAVLAMQYPVGGEAARRFVRHLYDKLAERKSIEEAVQDARLVLFTEFEEDRLFGSPVLYMQSFDSQLLPVRTGTPAGADSGPGSVSATGPPPRSQRDLLVSELWRLQQPPDLLNEVNRYLFETDWPQDPADVQRLLAQKVREHANNPDLAGVFATLVGSVQGKAGERIAS